MKKHKLLLVCAEPEDMVLRCAGTLKKYADDGRETYVIVLGRSDRVPEQKIREAAGLLSVSWLDLWDLPTHPLVIDREHTEKLALEFRRIRPDVIVTHDQLADYAHPDRDAASDAVRMAYTIASGAGAELGGYPVSPRQTPMFGLEPDRSDVCRFKPGIYLDITDQRPVRLQVQRLMGLSEETVETADCRCRQRGAEAGWQSGEKPAWAEVFSVWNPICSFDRFVW